MATFWLVAGVFVVLATALLLIPVWREQKRSGSRTLVAPLVALAVVPVSFALYTWQSTFDPELADAVQSDGIGGLEQLASRLSADPDDPAGWILLGRSYLQLGDYGRARRAFEQAWARVPEPDDTLKLAYAQALLLTEEGAALGLAGDLIEQVLSTAPQNVTALFFGGVVALERDQPAVARQRWSAVLATNPPPDVAEIVRSQLLALTDSAPAEVEPVEPGDAGAATIDIDVSVADAISLEDFGPSARVFVLARAPDSPAPLAVVNPPPTLAALPGRFTLSDADAMLPGRVLSQYDQVSVVARISASGQPTEQSGDAFAEATVDVAADEPVELVIDQIVP